MFAKSQMAKCVVGFIAQTDQTQHGSNRWERTGLHSTHHERPIGWQGTQTTVSNQWKEVFKKFQFA
jgi:hypothetical protein